MVKFVTSPQVPEKKTNHTAAAALCTDTFSHNQKTDLNQKYLFQALVESLMFDKVLLLGKGGRIIYLGETGGPLSL